MPDAFFIDDAFFILRVQRVTAVTTLYHPRVKFPYLKQDASGQRRIHVPMFYLSSWKVATASTVQSTQLSRLFCLYRNFVKDSPHQPHFKHCFWHSTHLVAVRNASKQKRYSTAENIHRSLTYLHSVDQPLISNTSGRTMAHSTSHGNPTRTS